MTFLTAAALLATVVTAQQIGTNTPEVHPLLPSQKCTRFGGCKTQNTSVVLDSQYRWLHATGGYNNCQVNGGWNSTLCPDGATCAENCAVEGVDYGSYGIQVNGSAITMNLFLQNGNTTSLASPRAYLLANDNTYDMFKLLNQEITYDIDVSGVPCGVNGALYLSEMLSDGGYNAKTNPAGAKYGTGYCDAQCPVTPFVVANGTTEVKKIFSLM
jgi:cellulose 1,4-beta-cellobiosidase